MESSENKYYKLLSSVEPEHMRSSHSDHTIAPWQLPKAALRKIQSESYFKYWIRRENLGYGARFESKTLYWEDQHTNLSTTAS